MSPGNCLVQFVGTLHLYMSEKVSSVSILYILCWSGRLATNTPDTTTHVLLSWMLHYDDVLSN